MHKLRDVMGKRDARYNLHGDVEIDEGFFSTETPEDQKDCPLKRGRGSQRKTSVLVMAESSFPDTPSDKKQSTPKAVGHIKMEVIDDLFEGLHRDAKDKTGYRREGERHHGRIQHIRLP